MGKFRFDYADLSYGGIIVGAKLSLSVDNVVLTQTTTFHTNLTDSTQAGSCLGSHIATTFGGKAPDVVILFASARHDYGALLRALDAACHPKVLAGCSSAGEFTSTAFGEGSASVVAIRSSDMHFSAALGRGLRQDRDAAARQIVDQFRGPALPNYQYRTALVLTDALAGHADDLVAQIIVHTAGAYQLFGGGAGDDGRFEHTHVFCGTEAVADAAVAVEILSQKPLGIGVQHGWVPASAAWRVTDASGMRLISVNAVPPVELLEEHAEATGQHFDRAEPLPFFLQNVLGIDTGSGFKLRVPLALHADGSIEMAADIPVGATVCIMSTTSASAALAAERASQAALKNLGDDEPAVALFFDCVATRLRTQGAFGTELEAVQNTLAPASYVGCNTYGQIARAEGQFGGFHNCTAVVCVIPK